MEYMTCLLKPDSDLTTWLRFNFEEGDGSVTSSQLIDMWPNKEHSKLQITKTVKRVFPSITTTRRTLGQIKQTIYIGLRFRQDPDSALIPIVILSLKEISVLALESGLSVLHLVENSVKIGQMLTICGRSIYKQLEICMDGTIAVQMGEKTISLQDFYLPAFMELTSTAVKNLLSVFQSIKACSGFLFNGDVSSENVTVDEWQENGKAYSCYRASTCTWAIPCRALKSTCIKCRRIKTNLQRRKKEQAELEEEMINLNKDEDDFMTEICNLYLPKELNNTNNLDTTAEECEANIRTDPAEGSSEDVQILASGKRKRPTKSKGNIYECVDCDESFTTKKALQCHIRRHTDVKRKQKFFTCPICHIKIAGTSAHHRHMQEHALRHIGHNPFRCQTCGADFEVRTGLQRHLKTHADTCKISKKPKYYRHRCETCDKVFWSRYLLIRHIRLHTGERPYVCQICNACFRAPAALCIHRYIHNNERRFECSECGKKFITHGALQTHEIVHTKVRPFKCHLCERPFGRKDNLNAHLKRHMKAKNNLPSHQDKIFKCDSCDQTFALELSRDLHKSIAHASDDSESGDIDNSETPTNTAQETVDTQPPDLPALFGIWN